MAVCLYYSVPFAAPVQGGIIYKKKYQSDNIILLFGKFYSKEMDKLMGDCNISYEKSLQYWSDIPPTLDGVLGGFGFISDVDIQGSEVFLKALLNSKSPPSTNSALDCGAGIGRITKLLLLPHFLNVDIVEPDEKFLNTIKQYVGEHQSKLGTLYKVGLQEFIPVKKYDIIWNQWVLGYLTDEDLVAYLNRCREALSENGVIVVKENVTSSGKTEKDNTDSSVTRGFKQYIRIFMKCHLKRIKQCKQENFPNGIYPVYMFALVPNHETVRNSNSDCEKINTVTSMEL